MAHFKALFLLLSSALVATACGDFVVPSTDGGSPEIDANSSNDDGGAIDASSPDDPDAGPRCGNNALEAGEDCDDGNDAYGDGCSSDCRVEEQCVITHNGGSPLSLSSIKVSTDGSSTVVGTTTLGANDSSGLFEERRAVTACGTHVYAAPRASGAIAHLESQPDGSLVAVDATLQPGIFSVHCLPDKNTLIALSEPPDGSAAMDMVSYSIGADGSLTLAGQQPLTFFNNSETNTFRDKVPAVVHPTTGNLWVVGYYSTDFTGFAESSAFRIAADSNSNTAVLEGPLDIGGSDVGSQIAMGNGGTQMVMAGLSGGCTGAWSLPASGILPAADMAQCSGNFSNGLTTAARRADTVFYQGHSEASVRIHDVANGTITFEGAANTSSGARVLQLLYNDSILFTVGRNDGEVTVFRASSDGKILTEASTVAIPVTSVKATTRVFCR